jgi:hypothetical protein
MIHPKRANYLVPVCLDTPDIRQLLLVRESLYPRILSESTILASKVDFWLSYSYDVGQPIPTNYAESESLASTRIPLDRIISSYFSRGIVYPTEAPMSD